MSAISTKDITVTKDSEELRSYIRGNVDEMLSTLAFKWVNMLEIFLEYHGISFKRYHDGDLITTVEVPDENGGLVTKKVYNNPIKTRVLYTAIRTCLSQVNKADPDFLVDVGDYAVDDIAQTYARLIKKEWARSNTAEEVDLAWLNAILYSEMFFRTYYAKETRDRMVKVYDDKGEFEEKEVKDKVIYRGVRARALNSFEVLTSADWKTDLNQCSWVAVRQLKTPEEIVEIYPEEFKDIEDISAGSFYAEGSSQLIFNPYAMMSNLYLAKIHPETMDIVGKSLTQLGVDTALLFRSDLVEVIEFFSNDLDARVVMVGDRIVEAERREEDFYPIVGKKINKDLFSIRGVSDLESAMPLSRIDDDLLDLRLSNLALQLSHMVLYNKNILGYLPPMEPGVGIGIDVPIGQPLKNIIEPISYYNQDFAVRPEQYDIEQKMFSSLGINAMMAGSQNPSVETTAREATLRNAAATSSLDDIVKKVEREVYSDIANQWAYYISRFYEDEFVFSLIDNNQTKYFKFLGGVKIDERDKYYLYTYRGYKFYEPRKSLLIVDQALASMIEEQDVSQETGMPIAGEATVGNTGIPGMMEAGQQSNTQVMPGGAELPQGMPGNVQEMLGGMLGASRGQVGDMQGQADLMPGLSLPQGQGAGPMDMQGVMPQERQQDPMEKDIEELGIKEQVLGKWSEFTSRICGNSDGKIQRVLTGAEMETFLLKFRVEAAGGIRLNRQIMRDELAQLAPFIGQLKDSPTMLPYLKFLLSQFDLGNIDKALPSKEAIQEEQMAKAQAMQMAQGQKGQANQPGQAAQPGSSMNEAMRPENIAMQAPGNSNISNPASIPGNPMKTNNPTGM